MRMLLLLLSLVFTAAAAAQTQVVKTVKDDRGWRLQIDGEDFGVKGVVWSYTPVGENYTYDLWAQPEDFITKVIDTDMALIKAMGGNAIRVFSTVPPRWIEYIYDRYGIYTMVNDLFGRYGITVDGRWQNPTDYSDPATRHALVEQARKTFETYKNTRGVLMYLLGNESNYGLEWTSSAIENLPGGERNDFKAKALYSVFEEALKLGKSIDPNRPMGLVNGDLQYLRILKDLVPSLDILGVNTYRGPQSYAAFYNSIAKDLDRPFVYTEFGADAYNVATEQEDQDAQARLIQSQWREVYDQAWGKGKAANALGGFVFEWMDEWWKAGMETGLDVHDVQGTWNNGGYAFDAVPGRNNMNEEWFGIVGQSRRTVDGVPRRLPRSAYFLLKDLWRLDLYTSTKDEVAKTFASTDLTAASSAGNIGQLRDNTTDPQPVVVPRGSVTSRTYVKGNDADWALLGRNSLTSASQVTFLGGFDLRTAEGLTGSFRLRVLNDAPVNDPKVDFADPPEASAQTTSTGPLKYVRTVELYQATVHYASAAVDATLHYHDGHTDWVNEGDFFGLLPESFDLVHPDKESSKTPFGVELLLPSLVPGLKVYAGPQLYWGAQPRVMAKYTGQWSGLSWALMHDEEIGIPDDTQFFTSQFADRWTSALVSYQLPGWGRADAGMLLAQYNRVNNTDHTYARLVGNDIETGLIFTLADASAYKLRVTADALPYLKLIGQVLYAGLLADTQPGMPREGSQIADIGTGNRFEIQGSAQATYGDFSFRATLLQRTPLVGPLTGAERNATQDEFSVLANRKTLDGEALFTWDSTGATYFHDWNNVDRETSPLAASVGLLYHFYQGATDKGTYLDGAVRKVFLAPLPEVSGTWSLKSRLAGRPLPGWKTALSFTAGRLQSAGSDGLNPDHPSRTPPFWTAAGQAAWDRVFLEGSYGVNNWGPFDWQREWNQTYPRQWMAGVAWGFKPISFLTDTDRVGVRFSGKTVDEASGASETDNGTIRSRFSAELYAGWTF